MKCKRALAVLLAVAAVFGVGYTNTFASGDVQAVSEYGDTESLVWNYTTGENTNGAFSVTANPWSKTVAIEYNGMSLSKAIKMETTTLIKFNAPSAGTLEVVTYAVKGDPYIEVNGKKYPVLKSGGVKIPVEAGDCTIKKDTSNTFLYYLAFTGEGGGTEDPGFLYGDATADGMIAADDAAAILQKVLLNSYSMPIEEKSAEWMKYIDVSDDGLLAADDALCVMQSVLVDSYKMPVIEKNQPK